MSTCARALRCSRSSLRSQPIASPLPPSLSCSDGADPASELPRPLPAGRGRRRTDFSAGEGKRSCETLVAWAREA
jgi:hypothetical protein